MARRDADVDRRHTGGEQAVQPFFFAMAYDSGRGKIVLFGGYAGSAVLGDTWEWDGASGTWDTRHPGGSKPSPPLLPRHGV